VQRWREKAGEGFKVGLAWKGDARNRLDRWRSIEWKQFSRILSVPGVRYFSLQKETNADVSDKGLIDWTKELLDFADTAALVANLDLVITVDTAVAHLAGAMGKPVWLLISAAPDFRWMLDRQDTPWYPSMRLFRQIKLGNWTSIVENARSSLLAEVTKC
jgi:ADP-heptose:LPS heptosyltransferase